MNRIWMLYLFLGMISFGVGEYFSKLYGNSPKASLMIYAIIAYVFGTITWLELMKHNNQLALMSTIWVVCSAIIAIILGVFVFKEVLSSTQWAGAILSFVALYLLIK